MNGLHIQGFFLSRDLRAVLRTFPALSRISTGSLVQPMFIRTGGGYMLFSGPPGDHTLPDIRNIMPDVLDPVFRTNASGGSAQQFRTRLCLRPDARHELRLKVALAYT